MVNTPSGIVPSLVFNVNNLGFTCLFRTYITQTISTMTAGKEYEAISILSVKGIVMSDTLPIVDGARQFIAVPVTYPKSIQLLHQSKLISVGFLLPHAIANHQIPNPPHTPIETDSCQFPTMTPVSIMAIVTVRDGLLFLKKSIIHPMLAVIAQIYPIWHVGIIFVMKHRTDRQIADKIPPKLCNVLTFPASPIKNAKSM